MMVSVPMIQSTLYVALVDKDGVYYVKSFPVTQTEVNFSGGINTGTPIGTLKPQTYSYIYEKDFPLVGDYDYNDLVFRIGVEHTTPKQVVVHVTLSAVGCNEQLAGYLRVMGCKFDDIDSVTTANGKTFNDNLPAGSKNFVRSYDLLICSTKNQPVITVCADAHWAMDPYQSIMENTGAIALRKYYNTSLDASPEYESRNSVSQSYIIYFKDSTIAENITLEEIDPFIVKNYNSGVYEVHLDELKASQVLYNYQVEFRIKDLPWALLIPSNDFKYPLEGVQIGFYKRTDTGVVFSDGAYKTTGHAFGAWVENHKVALDWYYYPDESQVWIF